MTAHRRHHDHDEPYGGELNDNHEEIHDIVRGDAVSIFCSIGGIRPEPDF